MPSVFDEKSQQPPDARLSQALVKASAPCHVSQLEGVSASWKFYGAKHGWQLKAVQGKRAVLPRAERGRFRGRPGAEA